jgi:hypothetical protein
MNNSQKLENEKYFTRVIALMNEGGTYNWPDAKESYIIKNGKFIGSKSGIRKMKEITTPSFHTNLIIK